VRRLDQSSADCFVFTFREGLLSAVGHDLVLRVTRFVVDVDEDARTVDARFDASSLRVEHAVRGGTADPDALSAGDRRQIETNVARDVLDAVRHPEVRFVGRAVREEADDLVVEGSLAIRGRERPLTVALRRRANRWVIETSLHQPDFGIAPFRAMFGALKVKPDVTVRMSIPA